MIIHHETLDLLFSNSEINPCLIFDSDKRGNLENKENENISALLPSL